MPQSGILHRLPIVPQCVGKFEVGTDSGKGLNHVRVRRQTEAHTCERACKSQN